MLPIVSAHPEPSVPTPAPDSNRPELVPSIPTDLTPAVSEVIRLSEAGSSEEVILGYIMGSRAPFNLSDDDILYLKDIGLSSPVVAAMLNRDHDLQGQGQVYTYDQKAYPATNPTAVAPQPIAPPAAEAVARGVELLRIAPMPRIEAGRGVR